MDAAQIWAFTGPVATAYIAQKWLACQGRRARGASGTTPDDHRPPADRPESAASLIRALHAAGDLNGLSGAQVALLVGTDARHARRVLAELRASRNGDGHDDTP